MPLEQVVRERIFAPLGLGETSLPSTAAIQGPHAHGYGSLRINGSGPLRDLTLINPSWAWAAGAIVSTANDLADFYRGLLRGEVVTKHLVWRMESTRLIAPGTWYGLGLASTRLPCGLEWGHDGAVPGYLTFALSSGNGVRQVVLSLNTSTLGAQASTNLQTVLLDAYCGKAARLS
jgi:D-alanyl-D-alanine carboxypeptidase